MTEEVKKRITDLKMKLERESVILMLYEARFAALEHFLTVSISNEDSAMILGVPSRYIRLMKHIHDTTEGDFQDYAIKLYDKIYVENDADHKQKFSHFKKYDEEILRLWLRRKLNEEDWNKRQIDKEESISNFCHVYYCNFGVDIEIRELPPEQAPVKGNKPEEVETKEMLEAFNKQLAEESLLTRMYRDGVIDEVICRKYMQAEELSPEAFQRIVQIHGEESQEESAESMAHTQKLEHQMELIAKLVNSEDITRNRAFEIMNINNDFHDFVEFLKILEIWEDKLHE